MLPSTCHYTINGHTVQTVKSAKYLGLTLSHNLSWSEYISRVTGKANSVLAFLQRNLYYCPQGLKVKPYLTYVRPIVAVCRRTVPLPLMLFAVLVNKSMVVTGSIVSDLPFDTFVVSALVFHK